DPDFLILDEPTSGLDPIGTRQVKDLLIELGQRGKTILLSSHLLADVEDVCDRMVMLYGGKIRAEGTAEELLADEGRTVIETPHLREETIARIEALILADEGYSIDRVHTGRQKLEDLFVDIVQRARQEQIETSGATNEGATARFLRSDTAQGEDLIDALTSEEEREPIVRAVEAAKRDVAAEAEQKRDEVLRDLTSPEAPEPPRVVETGRMPDAPRDVDTSLIDSLLDDDDAAGSGSARTP
ncbi:MAG: hypothetical protein KC983_05570, partial [Phycisphaerales bacterium]|nr:hypothetical protein [Phycisphaerales bacterium]